MDVIISSGKLQGSITANASKSAMQRAIAAALMAHGTSQISNISHSEDCLAALKIAEDLGATVSRKETEVTITSQGIMPKKQLVSCGESGLGIRMFTPIIALSPQKMTLTATGSLTQRPVRFFESVLPDLQVSCLTNSGKPPLQVHGPLQPKNITVDGSLSSQFITGLLLAFGGKADQKTITVTNLASKSYIALTLKIMAHFGVEVTHDNLEHFHFPKLQHYQPRAYEVEGDWSGAAFLLVAAAINGNVKLTQLSTASTQPDRAIINALTLAGAKTTLSSSSVNVEKSVLKSFHFDATDCPDLFPPLVALAANCTGISVLKGTHRLIHKESNRAETLREEFNKLGITIDLKNDEMHVHGGVVKSGHVHSHGDHRIAMACAAAATGSTGDLIISNAEAVNKSYPDFWQHWQELNAELKILT